MGRLTIAYVSSLALLGLVLWGILQSGGQLKAPHALAGFWTPAPGTNHAGAVPFTILQSGQFIRIVLDDDNPSDLRWTGETVDQKGARIIRLQGDKQSGVEVQVVPATQPNETAEYRFRFDGPVKGAWTAIRQAAAETPAPRQAH